MIKCRLIIVAALGLTLISSGQAQDEAQGEQWQAREQQQSSDAPPPPLIRVDIIEDQAAAEVRQRREAEARQREIDDLVAQQGMNDATQAMNDATQRMALYSLVSTIFVGIGTILLFATLYLTREANRAAQEAVAVTSEIGRRQLRAYVLPTKCSIADFQVGKHPKIVFRPTNSGQTPASELTITTTWRLGTDANAIRIRFGEQGIYRPDRRSVFFLGGGGEAEQTTHMPELTQNIWEQVTGEHTQIVFAGLISYRDAFGERHRTVFRYMSNGETLMLSEGSAMSACQKNNRSN